MSISRSVAISSAAAAVVAALLVTAPEAGAAPPEVGCVRCIVVDEDGNVLWARNARDRYPNASTTKMVTALLVSRATDPSDVVTVSSTAASIGGGGLDLSAGDTFTVDALLHALLLDSSNEAAQALAEHVSGSGSEFVADMNRYVRSIGAERSHFANPHGLDAEGHYSSAADLATIGAEVLEDRYLARIVRTREATIRTPRGVATFENRNELLEGYAGAIGIKTGRTLGAGYVLVAAAERGDHRVITVAMNSYDVFGDSAALLNWAFATLRRLDRRGDLIKAGAPAGALVFDSGSTEVVAGADLEGVLPRHPNEVDLTFEPSGDVRLPIEDGEVVGVITVSTTRGAAGTVPAIASDPIAAGDDGPWWAAPVVGLVRLVGGVVA